MSTSFPPPSFIPPPPPTGVVAAPRKPEHSGWAIASFITSLLGLSIVGVVLGHYALIRIKRSAGWLGGRGWAIAGLIMGYLQVMAIVAAVVAASSSDAATEHPSQQITDIAWA